jgi:hypothetical protein
VRFGTASSRSTIAATTEGLTTMIVLTTATTPSPLVKARSAPRVNAGVRDPGLYLPWLDLGIRAVTVSPSRLEEGRAVLGRVIDTEGGSDVMMSSSRGTRPIWRGGTGTLAQVWAGPSSRFVIKDSRFVDDGADTIVFHLEGAAKGVARRTVIRRTRGSDLSELSEGATMRLNGSQLTR